MLGWLRRQYDAEIHDRRLNIEQGQTPSVVAHSFGTYILGYTLLRFDFIRFNKVILCGSILPRDFPWDKLIERGQVQAVRNEFGVRDPWVKRVSCFVRGTGPSGASGFTCDHDRLEEEEFEYDHGDYFGIDHMEDRWIPFLNKALPEVPRATAGPRIQRPRSSAPWCLYGLVLAAGLFAAAFIPWLWRTLDKLRGIGPESERNQKIGISSNFSISEMRATFVELQDLRFDAAMKVCEQQSYPYWTFVKPSFEDFRASLTRSEAKELALMDDDGDDEAPKVEKVATVIQKKAEKKEACIERFLAFIDRAAYKSLKPHEGVSARDFSALKKLQEQNVGDLERFMERNLTLEVKIHLDPPCTELKMLERKQTVYRWLLLFGTYDGYNDAGNLHSTYKLLIKPLADAASARSRSEASGTKVWYCRFKEEAGRQFDEERRKYNDTLVRAYLHATDPKAKVEAGYDYREVDVIYIKDRVSEILRGLGYDPNGKFRVIPE
jgi:hypothetical protein